jgi:hypothetical protein
MPAMWEGLPIPHMNFNPGVAVDISGTNDSGMSAFFFVENICGNTINLLKYSFCAPQVQRRLNNELTA